MKVNAFYVFPALFLAATACWAEQDFYGIQMKNELWAQNLVLGTGAPADPQDQDRGPVLNPAVHAEASLIPSADDRIDFRLNVTNDSAVPIDSDYQERDFFIYLKNGQKYPLIDANDSANLDRIEPRSSHNFSPSLGNLKIRSEQVLMIVCSFGLGKTQVFLFPWSKKEQINRLTRPAEPAPAPAPAPQPEMRQEDPEPAPQTRERLDQAIKNFVYTPSTQTDKPSETDVPQRSEAHVIEYNKTYNFITLNLGSRDGLKQNTTITILRDGKTVAKAKIKQLRPAVSAATVLPSTLQTEIRAGDKIALV